MYSNKKKIQCIVPNNSEDKDESDEIVNILHLFTEWKNSRSDLNREEPTFLKFFINFLIKTMFQSRFDQSYYASQFIDLIYQNYGHLSNIMLPNEMNLQTEEHCNLVHYILSHAYQVKLSIMGRRISCLKVFDTLRYCPPIVFAVETKNLKLLHLLLRFGATFSFEEQCFDPRIRRYKYQKFMFGVLRKFVQQIIEKNPDLKKYEDLEFSPSEDQMYKDLISFCKLILRDFPQVSPYFLMAFRIREKHIRPPSIKQFSEEFSINIVTNFDTHFTKPMKLKHCCRQMIRKILNDKWLLPHGLYKLDLPSSFKLYLYLYED